MQIIVRKSLLFAVLVLCMKYNQHESAKIEGTVSTHDKPRSSHYISLRQAQNEMGARGDPIFTGFCRSQNRTQQIFGFNAHLDAWWNSYKLIILASFCKTFYLKGDTTQAKNMQRKILFTAYVVSACLLNNIECSPQAS